MNSNYLIVPSFSLTPTKLVLYNRFYKHYNGRYVKNDEKLNIKLDNLKRQFHGFEISDNANRNLKNKINWLYYLSKERKIKTYSGKNIFNFKISFITLTLPSKQVHSTSVITKECFNQFLTEIRQRFGLKNYVWRLEFQKNGNVHYHIVSDVYIDYFAIQKIWNRIINKLGYVDNYAKKFKNLSLYDYSNTVPGVKKNNFEIIKKRYVKGVKSDWKNPNSVDVKSVVSGKNIAGYIAKYFSKSSKTGKNCNPLDNEENSKNLRLWFCSRSLSKLSKISGAEADAPFNIFDILSAVRETFVVKAEYCTILFYSIKNLLKKDVNKVKSYLYDYAVKCGYYDNTIPI